LVLVAAGSLGVSPSVDSSVALVRFENPHLGHTLGIPAGWTASIRPADGATVVTSSGVSNRNDNPERIWLSHGGVYVLIFDYGRVRARGVAPRPARIQLGEKSTHSCGFGEGYMLNFTDHGTLLQVFVKLGQSTSTSTVLAVLNSLRQRADLIRPEESRWRVRTL
jgi:hypothetical protein